MRRGKIKQSNEAAILEAVSLLKSGQAIVFPTETVYGLGADAANEMAIDKIFQIKGRPKGQPLQILVENFDLARKLAQFGPQAEALGRHFWPGPLTIVLNRLRNPLVSQGVATGGETVGIRIPAHEITLKLLRLFGRPMASTSANLSGMESSTNALEAAGSIGNLVPFVIDGGRSTLGISSTVVSMLDDKVTILREGAISSEEIFAVLR